MGRKHKTPPNAVQPVPGPEDQVVGRRFIRLIEDQLAHLRRQPHHGNREVFFDQIVIAHLLAFFNFGLRSLRKIEDVSLEVSAEWMLETRGGSVMTNSRPMSYQEGRESPTCREPASHEEGWDGCHR